MVKYLEEINDNNVNKKIVMVTLAVYVGSQKTCKFIGIEYKAGES